MKVGNMDIGSPLRVCMKANILCISLSFIYRRLQELLRMTHI